MAQTKRANTEVITLTIDTASKDGFEELLLMFCNYAQLKKFTCPKKGEFMSKVIAAGTKALTLETPEVYFNK